MIFCLVKTKKYFLLSKQKIILRVGFLHLLLTTFCKHESTQVSTTREFLRNSIMLRYTSSTTTTDGRRDVSAYTSWHAGDSAS